jgi:hypothetical protein
MSAIPVNVQRARQGLGTGFVSPPDLQADVERVRALAKLMDASFEIAGVKVGWDSIIGLVPVLGDVATAAIAMYPIHIARKHKLSKLLQARMAANVLIDWAIGSVPVIGDLFDVAFKANLKNLALLEAAAAKK